MSPRLAAPAVLAGLALAACEPGSPSHQGKWFGLYLNGAWVRTEVVAEAGGSPDVVRAEVYLGAERRCGGHAPLVCSIDVTSLAEGGYTLTAQAFDSDGRRLRSAEAPFTVDRTPPRVVAYAPAPGSAAALGCPAKVVLDEAVTGAVVNGHALAPGYGPVVLFELDPAAVPATVPVHLALQDLAGNPAVFDFSLEVPSQLDVTLPAAPDGRSLTLARGRNGIFVAHGEAGPTRARSRIHDVCLGRERVVEAPRVELATRWSVLAAYPHDGAVNIVQANEPTQSLWSVAGAEDFAFDLSDLAGYGFGVLAWPSEDRALRRVCLSASRLGSDAWSAPSWPVCGGFGATVRSLSASIAGYEPVLAWVEVAESGPATVRTLSFGGGWVAQGPDPQVSAEATVLLARGGVGLRETVRAISDPGAGVHVERFSQGAGWARLPAAGDADAVAKQLLATPGGLVLLWQEPGPAAGTFALHAARLAPGAAAWEELTDPVIFASADPERPAVFALDGQGRPVLAWLEGSAAAPAVRVRFVNAQR